MVSEVKYPSFKTLGFRSSTTFLKLVVVAIFIGALLTLREKILYYVLPFFFTGYLLYGFVRPHISRAWRREIEEDEDDDDDDLGKAT
jgi:CDP-diacylglycerol--serine O-phosphatidyltransferase